MSTSILSSLNDYQKSAAEILSGPLLILAGAGSGKTKALTHRIANLISNGTSPGEILAVTFTNKAAKEMEGRIEQLLSENENGTKFEKFPDVGGWFSSKKPAVGTFHSTCVRILRADVEKLETGIDKNFVIFDTSDSQGLMKIIMKEKGIDDSEIKLRAVMSHISSAKNQLLSPVAYADDVESNRFTRAVKTLYPVYQKRLAQHNALDFDDLLQKVVELFEAKKDVLKKYQKRWSHLLVDEYQDTNFSQYRIIRLLSDMHKNLCVVGDDHQSIYAFRGADFRNILDFEKDFPDANVVRLEQNYRSTGHILKNANCLIRHNETGHEKNLWTENDSGEKVSVVELFDEKDEGRFIAQKIGELRQDQGMKYSDFAVLYRMNAQSRALEESFMKNQIPYQIIGGTRFFDRKEIKDVVAYLRLILNPRDDISFLRIINIPARKIGKASIEVLRTYAENYTMSLFEVLGMVDEIGELPAGKRGVLKDFWKMMNGLREKAKTDPISMVLDQVVHQTEFLKFLDDGTEEGDARVGNVKELFSVATKYDTAENSLAAFLEGVALISDLDNHKPDSDSVTLMTMHASKGLEFPVIFLPGWEDGIFPGEKSMAARDTLEEERRLAYVGITRAEKLCVISHARQRMLFGRTECRNSSMFLDELDGSCVDRETSGGGGGGFYGAASFGGGEDEDVSLKRDPFAKPKNRNEAIFGVMSKNETEFKAADRIQHAEFGEGTVIQISGDVLTVAFPEKGMIKLVASVAPIQKKS